MALENSIHLICRHALGRLDQKFGTIYALFASVTARQHMGVDGVDTKNLCRPQQFETFLSASALVELLNTRSTCSRRRRRGTRRCDNERAHRHETSNEIPSHGAPHLQR